MRITRLVATVPAIAIGLLLPLFLCTPCSAAESKLAQVSLPKVYNQSVKVKAVVEEIKKMQQDAMAKMNVLSEEISKTEQQLKEGQEKLGKEAREKAEADLKKKNEDLRSEQETAKVKIGFKQKSAQNVISGQIQEALEKISKDEGYTVIFTSEAVAYARELPDITDKVARGLDALPLPEGLLKP